MTKRTTGVYLITQYGNGDEGIQKVTNIPLPSHVKSIRGSDAKDEALEAHTDYLIKYIKEALELKEDRDRKTEHTDFWN